MANADIFKDAAIDVDEHDLSLQAGANDMKGHIITKDVVSLEKLYDLQDQFQGPRNNKTHISTMRHELINLGTKKVLKFVNLGTCCTQQEWQAFI